MRSLIRWTWTLALVVGFGGVTMAVFEPLQAQAQTAEQPKPGPEHRRLKVLVGSWAYEGEAKESPFGSPGKFRGGSTVRLVLDGFFAEARWSDKSADGYQARGVVMLGYDPANKRYFEHSFENDGSVTPTVVTVEGNTWISRGTRVDRKGVVYQMKLTSTFSADEKTRQERAEYSSDNGVTWKIFYELTNRKVKG